MNEFKRNNLIDLLRFVAAVSVAVFHIYYQFNSRPDSLYTIFFYKYGKLGVPMFFVISGYCIMIALKHTPRPFEFIIRRLFRIFPPYWFSLFFTGMIILILKLIYGYNSVAILPKTSHDILFTFCLLTYPFTKIGAINWVYWTLPYEVLFYLSVFFCSFFKKNYFTFLMMIITLGTYFVPSTDIGFLSFFKFWPLFCIGAALFKVLHIDKSTIGLDLTLFIGSVVAFYPAHQSLSFFLTSMLTVLLIVISHYIPLKGNIMSRLGDVSYSIYLIHVPLAVYCFGRYRELAPLKYSSFLNPILDLLLMIVVVIISKVVYKYIELPSMNIGKRLSKIGEE